MVKRKKQDDYASEICNIQNKYINTPVSQYEDYKIPVEILNNSINNNDEKNIAIIGPYGAGKSSVVNTYLNRYKKSKFALKISLSSFEDSCQCDNEKNEKKIDDEKIEKAILQQFIYEKPYSKLKDTTITRIKDTSKSLTTFRCLYVIVLFLSCFLLILNKTSFLWKEIPSISIASIILSCVAGCIVLGDIVIHLRLDKIIVKANSSVLNFETELSKVENKNLSLLNAFADEIIYSLKKSHYSIVVIEDLDRVATLNIYTKLRELNYLINNNVYFKKNKVSFVYCLDDKLFNNPEERSKFFERIITIEPYLNYSNACKKVKDKLRELSQYFDQNNVDTFANNMAPYIKSQRVLNNIFYDFEIQKVKDKYVNRDNKDYKDTQDNYELLALLIYKNLYPTDFSKVFRQQGVLYSIFNEDKRKLIASKMKDLDSLINEKQKNIKNANQEYFKSVEELELFVLGIIRKYSISSSYSYSNEVKLQDIDDESKSVYINGYSYSLKEINRTIAANNLGFDIFSRLRNIKNQNNEEQDRIQNEIAQLSNEKIRLYSLTLKEFIEKYTIDEILKENPHVDSFLALCLSQNYINENFVYQLIVRIGNNTKRDLEFIQNVNVRKSTDYDCKLDDPIAVIQTLDENNFKLKYILNYSLLDYCLSTVNLETSKTRALLSQLSDGSQSSNDFIIKYLSIYQGNLEILKHVGQENVSLFRDIFSPNIDNNLKNSIADLIVSGADFKFDKINNMNLLTNYFDSTNNQNFLNLKDDITINNLVSLNVKFETINENLSNDYLRAIRDNNLYKCNLHNIKLILYKTFKFKRDVIEDKTLLMDILSIKTLKSNFYEYVIGNIYELIEDMIKQGLDGIYLPSEFFELLLSQRNARKEQKLYLINHFSFELDRFYEFDKNETEHLIKNNKVKCDLKILYEYWSRFSDLLPKMAENINSNFYKMYCYDVKTKTYKIDNSLIVEPSALVSTKDFRLSLLNELISAAKRKHKNINVLQLLQYCQLESVDINEVNNICEIDEANMQKLIENKILIFNQQLCKVVLNNDKMFSLFVNIYEVEISENINEPWIKENRWRLLFNKNVSVELKNIILRQCDDVIPINTIIDYNGLLQLIETCENKYLLIKSCIVSKIISIAEKVRLLSSNINNLDKTQTIELLCLISDKYKKLDDHEFTITIPSEYCSEAIVKFLKDKKIIGVRSGQTSKKNIITLKKATK